MGLAAQTATFDVVATGGDTIDLTSELEQYRKELTGYCYRMLGSVFEADDAVQETMVRAWKSIDSFEGRSALRSWLYRIATNVCLDMLRGRQRRAVAMDLGPSGTAETFAGATRPEEAWLTPIPDSRVVPDDGDPAEVAAVRESIKLAFVTALQHLPARQRAALILCEVLKWRAAEVAELLETSVASINSALQRARATLADRAIDLEAVAAPAAGAEDNSEILARFVDAFERYDMDALVKLLHDDAVMSMPPFDFWLEGAGTIVEFYVGPGAACRDSKVIVTAANGAPAFASYKAEPDGRYLPWAVHVLDVEGGVVVGQHSFIGPQMFEAFGLPAHLDA